MPDPRPPEYRRPVLPWERKAEDRDAYRWVGIGLEFAACVVLFFLGGKFLDGTLGTAPLWTAVGSLLGVAAGMYLLIRSALRGERPSPPGDTARGGSSGSAGAPSSDAARADPDEEPR